MNRKLPITFISMLMLLSLVCVGFAAWCIDDSLAISDSVTGSFDVDNIISGEGGYLTTNAVVFEYYDNTFLNIQKDESGAITSVTQSNIGYIIITANVNKANLNGLTSPKFNISLTQSDETATDLLNNSTATYVTNIYVNQTSGNGLNITRSDFKVSTEFTPETPLADSYSFIIEFTVSENDPIFFKTLFEKQISFGYSVTIEGE